MIPQDKLDFFYSKIKSSSRPLFFFDDDCDGVTSFVQYYWVNSEAKGVIVKGKPELEEGYLRKVEEYNPDLVVILDKPMVSDDFLRGVSCEVLWLDHHPVQSPRGVFYLNPLVYDFSDNRPTSYWVYKSIPSFEKKSLWLAMIGVVGDWDLSLVDEFSKEYSDLMPEGDFSVGNILFNSQIGLLVKVVNFNLKGKTSEVMKSVKTLTRIENPGEILHQSTSKGKFVYKKFESVNKIFEHHKSLVSGGDDLFVVYMYEDQTSITGDLSNELIYSYPDKVIVVGRVHNGKVMMSLRSGKHKVIDSLNQALSGLDAYGGGHDFACGACVLESDMDVFMTRFKQGFE